MFAGISPAPAVLEAKGGHGCNALRLLAGTLEAMA
jgi:hypothetical protein